MIHKTKTIFIILSFLTSLLAIPAAATAAVIPGEQQSVSSANPSTSTNSGDAGVTEQQLQSSLKNNPIVKNILNPVVNFLTAGVGIVVIAVIILGGIQYTMAGSSPEAVGKAKQRIINGLLALVLYLLIFSFLQWIVPGGLFNS